LKYEFRTTQFKDKVENDAKIDPGISLSEPEFPERA